MKNIPLLFMAAVWALAGCNSVPAQRDVFAEMGAGGPAICKDLTAAIFLSQQTKDSIMGGEKVDKDLFGRRMGWFQMDRWTDDMIAGLGSHLKKVIKVDSMDSAEKSNADLIVAVDNYGSLDHGHSRMKLVLGAVLMRPDGEVIDIIRSTPIVKSLAFRTPDFSNELAREAQRHFDIAFLGSNKLKAFVRGRSIPVPDVPPLAPVAAMPAVVPTALQARIHSDVDVPGHKFAEKPSDFAMVIGVEKYSNDLPDANFAERDAAAVKSHLLALGYPERNIKFLLGSRAVRSALEAYLEDWLPRNVTGNSRVFFYFSGHGAPDPASGQAYLVPWDGNPNFLDKTAYPVKKLYRNLGALKAKQVIVALDSCFSGAGGRSVLAEGARPLVTHVDTSLAPGGKVLLFAAASASEITSTLPEQGHGIFTYYFLKGLDGAAQDASGVITPTGLYEYLKPKVQDAASRQNRDQTPVLEGARDGEIVRFE